MSLRARAKKLEAFKHLPTLSSIRFINKLLENRFIHKLGQSFPITFYRMFMPRVNASSRCKSPWNAISNSYHECYTNNEINRIDTVAHRGAVY